MNEEKFVFVPSIVTIEGLIEGLGIFSKESSALDVLKNRLNKNWSSGYKEAQLVMWELDSDESKAIPLKHMYANVCPICDERTFWTDAIELNALCYLPTCQAWIESSDIETDKVDCGWPPIGYTSQVDSLADALSSLRTYGAKIRASATEDSDIFTHRTLLEEYEKSLNKDST